MERRVIIIAGPTCSGKTALAFELARMLDSEIISADSRQIYKHINIGTAKPGADLMKQVRHHLIDKLELDQVYNASAFEHDACIIINELHSAGRIPVVAGGTGLYINALINGIVDVPPNEKIRNDLFAVKDSLGIDHLYNELARIDPEAAASMIPKNWKRVMRALEVKLCTGRSILEHHSQTRKKREFDFLYLGLSWNRAQLYDNIDRRVDKMISDGLIDEVRHLMQNGLTPQLNSLNTVGYKEVFALLNGTIPMEECVRLIKRNTRHYAKRQMTWFRAQENIEWLNVDDGTSMIMLANSIISRGCSANVY